MKPHLMLPAVLVTGCLLTYVYSSPVTLLTPTSGLPGESVEADVAAIKQTAKSFAEAFNRGDAKAVASHWTENGECREEVGRVMIGRDTIEKEYAAFFKENKDCKIEVLMKSVRFPAHDMAIEEGLLRQSNGTKDLPTSTTYEAIHVREGGQWKIALTSEGGEGQDRLEDLDWLLGEWTTKVKGDDVTLSFVHDPSRPLITATFTRTPAGKPAVSGSIRVALDPETGRIRSWGFEDDGAHAQSIWHNDGKAWVLDQTGVLADGTPAAERIILQRAGSDVITWRAIDRKVGDNLLADTPPMRLTRKASK